LAGLHENIKDISMGKFKYDWWRTVMDSTLSGQPVDHPISIAIADALENCELSKSWINRIISAREDLKRRDTVFSTMNELETYAENSSSALLYLQLEALGLQNVNADHCASHIGKAVGISSILRGVPLGLATGEIGIPSEILAKHSVSAERILRNGPSKEFESAVFETATRANDHLISARTFAASLPPDAIKVMLHAVPCEQYLNRLQRTNFDLFDTSLMQRTILTPLHIWWNAKRRTF
jgi:NADH dehydrogenase [ubiquinone] 1 alpha subcomplex assembly factor 6